VKWIAPEYYHYPKTELWIWSSVFVAILLIAFSLWQKNFLFAVFLGIAELLIVSWSARKPHKMTFTISENGVRLDQKKFYTYDELLGFAVIKPGFDDQYFELVLETKSHINQFVKIMLPKERRADVFEAINTHLDEIEYEETVFERIEHILGF